MPESAFMMTGIGVQHRSESVFTFDRNGCSRWAGIRSISKEITAKLLSLFQGKPVWATTSNQFMESTLKKNGFTQKGSSWKSKKGDDLQLWIKG